MRQARCIGQIREIGGRPCGRLAWKERKSGSPETYGLYGQGKSALQYRRRAVARMPDVIDKRRRITPYVTFRRIRGVRNAAYNW